MGRIPTHIVDQIYNVMDIVEVVSDYMPLKKRGANYWALSPFSNEKTPSFAVNPVKGIFKDFSSQKGGNAITFLMEMEGYDYVEALKHLAKRYNIEIEEEEDNPEAKIQRDKRESLFIVNEFAARWFQEQLTQTEVGKNIGLSYFKERGLLQSTIDTFQLGYAPDSWDSFVKAAEEKQYNEEYLTELGLCSRSQKTDKLLDRFRDRVMFPISNQMGKIVGFGGRIMGDRKDVGKYINSPESSIYHKSQILYGLHLAKKAIREKDLCILTEGYMDVILLYQNGIQNVVASSGTALTPEQIRLIRRYTQNVLIIFDGDKAGIKAAMRGIDLILKERMTVKVLLLPDGHDPDSYVLEHGPTAFMEYAEKEAYSFIDFKIKVLQGDKSFSDPEVQSEIVNELAKTLANLGDAVQRQLYVKHVAERFKISEALMSRAVHDAGKEQTKLDQRERRREEARKQVEDPGEVKEMKSFEKLELASQEKELLRILVNYHDRSFGEGEGAILTTSTGEEIGGDTEAERIPMVDFFRVELQGLTFENQVFEQLKNEIFSIYEREEKLNIHHYLNHADKAVGRLISDLLADTYEMSPNWKKYDALVSEMDSNLERTVKDAMYHYKYRKIDKLIHENRERLQKAEEEKSEEMDLLLETYMHLIGLKRAIGQRIGTEGAVRGDDAVL
ncbi:MAG: DNA primase [Bacteroidota bacterium]